MINNNDLKMEALALDDLAKKAREEKKFDEAADYHQKAAKAFKKIGDETNYKYNCANYYLSRGKTFSYNKDYINSLKYLKKAEKLFIDINVKGPAFHCAADILYSKYLMHNNEIKNIQEFIELVELFIDRYKDYSTNLRYQDVKLKYFVAKSTYYRIERKFELAEIWAKECYESAQHLYLKYGDENYKKLSIYNQHMYWNLRAKRLQAESNWKEAAESFKEAAVIIYDIDKKLANDNYKNYYQCLAILNKRDKDVFLSNINEAIKLMDDNENLKEKNYLLAFKYDNLVKFAQDPEERLEFLEKAKTYYYKSDNPLFAKGIEYFIFYNLSKRCLKEGKYQSSLNYFDKAINYSKYAYFPNVVPSKDILINERYLHEFYLHVSNGSFSEASEMIKKWLVTGKDIKDTRKYKFYEISGFCCELISKNYFLRDDLFYLEYDIDFVRKNRLGLNLYDICSLVYAHVSLWTNNIQDNNILEKIKLEIISKITTEDAASYVEKSLKVKSALEEREWLLQLPQSFAEKFDKSVFHLENSVEGFKQGAFLEFYKLLENFVRVIVEFNGKILWGNEFKEKLEEKISERNTNEKSFEVFALGDLLNSIKILKNEDSKFCKNIPESTLDLLNEHIPIRNALAHDHSDPDLSEVNIIRDTSKIIYNFLPSFPTIVKIKNTEKKPWYNAEIQWNQFPKLITIYYDEQNLEEGDYYTEPMLKVLDNCVSPELLIKK